MLRAIKASKQLVTTVESRLKFPEKLKGTMFEKWADYWKNLLIDYRQMVIDLRSDIQDNPRKAFKYTIGLTAIYALSRNNPSEADFKEELANTTNEIIMLSEECQNPNTIEHLRFLQYCNIQSVLHYRSLGIASVMYLSDFSDSCSLYKAQCPYLKPLFGIPFKIVDFGIMGRWWNIYAKMADYDVNL